jgi:LytR cell envelope-related transcriptional attenuator
MSLSFASLSVHSFVTSVGAYVGLGSLLAVALLVILYFAHARETATLRDRLDEAQQRISGLEGRIAQLMQMQASQRGRGQAPVAPAPAVPARPAGAPQGSVRRVPNPATAAAAATAPVAGLAAAATQPRPAAAVPAAPAGVAGPALASATKLIPDLATAGDPDDTMFVPAAAVANGKAGADHTAVLAAAKPTPAAAASARAASASPRGAVAAPPRMQIGAEQDDADAPATAAGGAGRIRRIGGNPQTPTVLPAFDDELVGGRGRFSGALLPLMIAGIAVVVIVAGLIVISNSGGSTSGNVSHGNTNAGTTGQALHNKKTAPAPFSAVGFRVAVLNGTAQSGLAGDVGTKLVGDGYKKGNITNAAAQTERLTYVYYVPGTASKANKTAAQHVAKALTLPPSRVRAAGKSVVQSCTISPTGTSLGSCTAQVIVSVGQDRQNLATG